MGVLFGDMREDGLIRVGRTLHRVGGKEVKIEDYPEGYEIDGLPDVPEVEPGINPIWLFNPDTGEHSFEFEEREWTQEELMNHKLPEMEQLIADLTEIILEV